VRITIDDLKAAGAREDCPGLAWFREFFGGDVAERKWTFDLQMEIIRAEGRLWLMWGVHRRIVPLFSMRDADLSETNLRDADLSETDLRGADLHGANLHGANLRGAGLSETDLRGANLRGADLTGANLRGANLRGAKLNWADLRRTNLRGANLSETDLTGANLADARHDEATRWPKGWPAVSEERK
jgi:uncharacterized protein YjbI with pentapeptide repeats